MNYELINPTRENYHAVLAQMVADYAANVIGAEVYNHGSGYGRIVDCFASGTAFDSTVFTVHFDNADDNDNKNYLAAFAIEHGGLVLTDKSLVDLWNDFMEQQYKLRAQYNKAVEDRQRREKEAEAQQLKQQKLEKKRASMRAAAEKELANLLNSRELVTKADEFYYMLGYLAAHIGTLTAKMPDFLEESFVKHFGDVKRTVVDSTKVGPAGYTSQWRLSMEASLVKAGDIPAMLNPYLSHNGKKVSKTDFVWGLVDDYGFQFGKKQDVNEIMDHIPVNFLAMFTAGTKA